MKIQRFKIENTHKNFNNLEIDFSNCKGVAAFIGDNASGKSNLLEALSAIFKNIYLEEKDEFDYFLEYTTFTNANVKITSNAKGRIYAVNGNPVHDIKQHLPKRVIAIYSGEEDRLWKNYYAPVYLDYIESIAKNNNLEYPRMFFLNKFYWHIILLSLLMSDAEDVKEFIKNKLGIDKVNNIKFKFYKTRYENYKNNPALSLIRRLDNKENYTLEEFKKLVSGDYSTSDFSSNDFFNGYNPTDIFQAFYVAFTPKDYKIIDEIDITFNDNLKLSALSEGQKKLLLIKAALEFASSEDTLVLLDEPDAHIHIGNKQEVVKVFDPYKDTRQIILTTHSPTLTQTLNDDNVFMLTKGELINKDKQYIINELTKDFWSKQKQNLFLASEKDTILVEGKTDIKHLQTALEKLSEIDSKYSQLNLKYLPFNGASGLKLFVDEFPVSKDVKTIAFVDRDQPGFDAIKETLDFKGTKDEFKGAEKNGIFISYIPKKDGHTKSEFVIEDYYPLEKYKSFLFENVSCVTEMPNHSSSRFKVKFAEKAKEFDPTDFEGFKKLFDLIIEIKNSSLNQKTIVKQSDGEQKKKPKELRSLTKERKTYAEEDHFKKGSQTTVNLYKELKKSILSLDNDIKIIPLKDYIAFKKKSNIVDITIQSKQIKMWLNLKKGQLNDERGLTRDVSNTGHWGNGDYELIIKNKSNFAYIVGLINQVLELE
jgi:predicted transport protein/ABC-type cobalamin/Fe3+-siderophores transport system ATPase subunit